MKTTRIEHARRRAPQRWIVAPQRLMVVLYLTGALLGGCQRPPSAATAVIPAAARADQVEGVVLTPEQAGKLGVVTDVVRSMSYAEETAGYGVVLAHEAIAQAAAELVTAQATAKLSRSALMRANRLSGTPGAVSADVEETAARQAAVDSAALTLTIQRMSSTLGMNPPWKSGENGAVLKDLAAGRTKLVRVTFPLGSLSGAPPARLRAAHLGAGQSAGGWTLSRIWDAPADASVPGRSYFALLQGSDAGEGERLMVWAPTGEAVVGALVPAAAAVMSDAKFWCYLEKKPGTFVRAEIDTARPVAAGYFVTGGIAAGDKVVIKAAGQLLAQESASGAGAD